MESEERERDGGRSVWAESKYRKDKKGERRRKRRRRAGRMVLGGSDQN